jgi:hypothetical protein
MVEAEDPSVTEPANGAGREMIMNGSQGNARRSYTAGALGKDGRVVVGVTAGAWKDGGAITMGQEVQVAGVRVKLVSLEQALRKMSGSAGSSWLKSEQTERADVEVEVVVLDKAGNVVETERTPVVRFGERRKDRESMGGMTTNVPAVEEDIGGYRVRWRERQWTVFAGMAEAPGVSPDALQTGTGTVGTAPPTTNAATAPATGSPEAFMERVRAAAESGDAKRVRGLMAAEKEADQRLADTMAEDLASKSVLHAAAVKRFGAEETDGALVRPGLVIDMRQWDEHRKGMDWKVEGDRATPVSRDPNVHMTAGPGSALVRVEGDWRLDMAMPKDFTGAQRAELDKQLGMQEHVAKVRRAVASEIQQGKYKDAYEARDALVARLKEQ